MRESSWGRVMRAPMWLRRIVSWLALLMAVGLVYRLGIIWWTRLFYPFDLEWMEGGMLAHAWRVTEGHTLYGEPSAEWIPYIYPAGYAWLLAAVSPVFGLGYVPARALSIVGTLAAASALPWMTWRHHKKPWVGLLAGAAFLGCYDVVGAFFDLVRADGVSIGLVAWTVVLGLDEDRRLRDLSALLLFGAFAVKQNFALFGIPMALGLWARLGWKDALRFGLLSAVPALAITGLLEWQSNGYYLRYIVETPGTHGFVRNRGFPGAPRELIRALPAVVFLVTVFVIDRARVLAHSAVIPAMGVIGLVLGGVNHSLTSTGSVLLHRVSSVGYALIAASILGTLAVVARRNPSWRWIYGAGVGGIALISAALMRAHVGGFVNVLIPLYWVVCAGSAWGAARWEGSRVGWVAVLPTVLLGTQLGLQHWRLDDDKFLPTAADVAAGERVVDALRGVEGPVFSPFAPWLVYQAGGEPGTHLISIWDVTKKRTPFPDAEAAIETAIANQEFAAVLDGGRGLKYGLADAYSGAKPINGFAVFMPQSGFRVRPERLRFPKKRAPSTPETPSVPASPAPDSAAP